MYPRLRDELICKSMGDVENGEQRETVKDCPWRGKIFCFNGSMKIFFNEREDRRAEGRMEGKREGGK